MFYQLMQRDFDYNDEYTLGYFKNLSDLKAFIKLNNYCYIDHHKLDSDTVDKILANASMIKLNSLLYNTYHIVIRHLWTRPLGNYDFLDADDIF